MKLLRISLITLIVLLIAFSSPQISIEEREGPPTWYFDELIVILHDNGTVSLVVVSELEEVPVLLPYIEGVYRDEVWLVYYVGERIECIFWFNSELIGVEEAKIEAPRALEEIEEWLGVKFDKRSLEIIHRSYAEDMYKYVAAPTNFNPDIITNKFLSLIPKEGLLSLISRKTLKRGDKLTLFFQLGKKTGRIKYKAVRKNYFNFRIGETYRLDVFELFNFTGPLIVHHLANHNSWVKILSDYIWTTDFRLYPIKVEIPFPHTVMKTKSGFEIMNKLMFSLKGGDRVEYIRVTFKVVEAGFKQPINPINITGMVIAFSVIAVAGVIIYKFKSRKSR